MDCPKCGNELKVDDKDGNYRIGGQQVCADCYFDGIGEEVERAPVVNPERVTRPAGEGHE